MKYTPKNKLRSTSKDREYNEYRQWREEHRTKTTTALIISIFTVKPVLIELIIRIQTEQDVSDPNDNDSGDYDPDNYFDYDFNYDNR